MNTQSLFALFLLPTSRKCNFSVFTFFGYVSLLLVVQNNRLETRFSWLMYVAIGLGPRA